MIDDRSKQELLLANYGTNYFFERQQEEGGAVWKNVIYRGEAHQHMAVGEERD